jgi:hypothetical protein
MHWEGVFAYFLADGSAPQALGLGDTLLELNDPVISGIVTKDPTEIVQWFLHTCDVHCDW